MKPANYTLVIYAGTTLDSAALNFTYKVGTTAVDLTGASVRAMGRNPRGEVLFDWSTANGKLSLDAPNGVIGFNVTAAETSALGSVPGPLHGYEAGAALYVVGNWALEITAADGRVSRLMQGSVQVSREVVYG